MATVVRSTYGDRRAGCFRGDPTFVARRTQADIRRPAPSYLSSSQLRTATVPRLSAIASRCGSSVPNGDIRTREEPFLAPDSKSVRRDAQALEAFGLGLERSWP
jgi:hypothetical protein